MGLIKVDTRSLDYSSHNCNSSGMGFLRWCKIASVHSISVNESSSSDFTFLTPRHRQDFSFHSLLSNIKNGSTCPTLTPENTKPRTPNLQGCQSMECFGQARSVTPPRHVTQDEQVGISPQYNSCVLVV